MSLFGYAKEYDMMKLYNKLVMRADAADTDRRRIKDNADKFGGLLTDLECRVKKLEGGHKHGRKKRS